MDGRREQREIERASKGPPRKRRVNVRLERLYNDEDKAENTIEGD